MRSALTERTHPACGGRASLPALIFAEQGAGKDACGPHAGMRALYYGYQRLTADRSFKPDNNSEAGHFKEG
jgi:hypothetical protein